MGIPKLSTPKFNYISVILNILLLLATISAAIYTANTASKITPIYGIEKIEYYDSEENAVKELNKKLDSGKYIILQHKGGTINMPGAGYSQTYMLGKIKR